MKMRGKIKALVLWLLPVLVASCRIHEFPPVPEYSEIIVNVKSRLSVAASWEQDAELYDFEDEAFNGCKVRYVVRTFASDNGVVTSRIPVDEFVYTYDYDDNIEKEFHLMLKPGSYEVMIWTDIVDESATPMFIYNTDSFDAITFTDVYQGNTSLRECFRGTAHVDVPASIMETVRPVELIVEMTRPIAKFEVVATDLKEFVDMEMKSKSLQAPRGISLDDYKVFFHYQGFVPDTYDMFSDRPSDSAEGLSFESAFRMTGDGRVSLGTDHIFVGHQETAVSVKIGIYDLSGNMISLTPVIKVPLLRNRHTVMEGEFMTRKASGGISAETEFDGEYNYEITL